MSDRLDELRSLVRLFADRASERVREMPITKNVRRLVTDLQKQRSSVRDEALSSAVTQIAEAESGTATARRGAIHIDLAFTDGRRLVASLEPLAPRFAPRGAKEISFRVEPESAAFDGRLQDAAAAIAAVIGKTLYGMVMPAASFTANGGIVDRDADVLRIDLRNLPALRRAQSGPFGVLLDVFELESLVAEDGELALRLKMPSGIAR